MQLLVSRGLLINPTQEFQPLLVAMPIHAGADDFSIRDIERGEQRGRTVALIIVSPRFTSPFLHSEVLVECDPELEFGSSHRWTGPGHAPVDLGITPRCLPASR